MDGVYKMNYTQIFKIATAYAAIQAAAVLTTDAKAPVYNDWQVPVSGNVTDQTVSNKTVLSQTKTTMTQTQTQTTVTKTVAMQKPVTKTKMATVKTPVEGVIAGNLMNEETVILPQGNDLFKDETTLHREGMLFVTADQLNKVDIPTLEKRTDLLVPRVMLGETTVLENTLTNVKVQVSATNVVRLGEVGPDYKICSDEVPLVFSATMPAVKPVEKVQPIVDSSTNVLTSGTRECGEVTLVFSATKPVQKEIVVEKTVAVEQVGCGCAPITIGCGCQAETKLTLQEQIVRYNQNVRQTDAAMDYVRTKTDGQMTPVSMELIKSYGKTAAGVAKAYKDHIIVTELGLDENGKPVYMYCPKTPKDEEVFYGKIAASAAAMERVSKEAVRHIGNLDNCCGKEQVDCWTSIDLEKIGSSTFIKSSNYIKLRNEALRQINCNCKQ